MVFERIELEAVVVCFEPQTIGGPAEIKSRLFMKRKYEALA